MNNTYVSKALLEFIESDFKTIKECLDAAEELNMKQFFSEGDESIQDVMNNQADVDNPDDGEHDHDEGATGDRFNDFMDQIPQMNPSDDSENFDGDSEEPVYNEDGNGDEGEDYHNDLMSDTAPEGDTDNLMGGNGFDSMPMSDMMGGMMPQQPMMQPIGMPMQPMMSSQPMMMPQPMVQPVMAAQPVQMPMYGQPMQPVQPFAQMQPGVMQTQMPNNMPYAGGTAQEMPPANQPPAEDSNALPPEDPNAAPPTDPTADPNVQPPADPNQPVDSVENIPDETGTPNDWDTPASDPNTAPPAEDHNAQADPGQEAAPPAEDPNALPPEDPNAAPPTDPNVDPNAVDPNMQDMAGMPDDPTAAMQDGDPNSDPNAMPADPNMPMDPNDPNAQMDPNADPNAMPGDPTQQQGPDENQRLSHNIDQLNKLETQVSNLSEKINNEKIDKLKKSINQLINGVTDNMANLRDKPELPKLNDMIEKFLNNCIDELNSVVDKEKSKQNQQEDQDNQFRKNDEVNPNDMPDQQADNQTVQQPVQKGY